MAQLVLWKSLTYAYKGRVYRRGVPVEVTDSDDYHFLCAHGFRNPDQDLTSVHPSQLWMAPPGTEIPVIRTGGLGDVLMTLPGLRDLAGQYPQHRFLFVTHPAFFPLFRDVPFVQRTATVESIRGRWKFVVELRGLTERSGNERLHRIDCFSRYMNRRPPSSYEYPLRVRDEDIGRGVGLIGGGDEPFLLLGVGSISQNGMRDWPESYQDELVELAAGAGWKVGIADPRRRELSPAMRAAKALNLTGRLSIPDLMAVLAVTDCVVSPDTGLVHLAEALGRPTVAYFTTVPPEARVARYRYVRALYAGVACAPCYHQPTCGLAPRTTKCALAVTPRRVWEEVEYVSTHEPPYHFKALIQNPAVEFRRQEVRAELQTLSMGVA